MSIYIASPLTAPQKEKAKRVRRVPGLMFLIIGDFRNNISWVLLQKPISIMKPLPGNREFLKDPFLLKTDLPYLILKNCELFCKISGCTFLIFGPPLLILQGSAIYHDAIDLFVFLSMIDRAVILISIH